MRILNNDIYPRTPHEMLQQAKDNHATNVQKLEDYEANTNAEIPPIALHILSTEEAFIATIESRLDN